MAVRQQAPTLRRDHVSDAMVLRHFMERLLRPRLSFTVIASTGAKSTGSNTVTTSGIDTSGANLIIVAVSHDGPDNSPTDSTGSNTWTAVDTAVGSAPLIRMFTCFNPTTDAAQTFTYSNGFPSIGVLAVSGAASGTADQKSKAGPNASQPGSITPSEDNELLVTCAVNGGAASEGPPSAPFSSHFIIDLVGDANSYTLAMAYEIQTTATARNPTWNNAGGGGSTVIASFKASAGGVQDICHLMNLW